MILLIIARTFGLREGWLYRAAMLLTIGGVTIASLATWSVMVVEKIAHKIINVGAAFLLPGALLVAFYGFFRLAQEAQEKGLAWRLRAVLHDPIRFGILFELLFVNFVVTIPDVYVAFNLETYRRPNYLAVERTILVGHWHVLATLSAVIVLFLVVDRLGVQGWLRQLVGWGGAARLHAGLCLRAVLPVPAAGPAGRLGDALDGRWRWRIPGCAGRIPGRSTGRGADRPPTLKSRREGCGDHDHLR